MGRLNFTKLPPIEVVIRLARADAIPLDLKRVMTIASAFEKDFPEVTSLDAPVPSVGMPLELSFGQLFGCQARNPINGSGLLIQSNLIAVTWQNKSLEVGPNYVRYEGLRESLRSSAQTIEKI